MGTTMLMSTTDLVGKIGVGKGASATIQRLAIQVSSGFPSVQFDCGCSNYEIGEKVFDDLFHHNHPVIEILPYFQIHKSGFLLNKGNVRVPRPNLGAVIVKLKVIDIDKMVTVMRRRRKRMMMEKEKMMRMMMIFTMMKT